MLTLGRPRARLRAVSRHAKMLLARTAAPAVAGPETFAKATGAIFATGGLVSLAALAFPQGPDVDVAALRLMAVLAVGFGLVEALLLKGRMPAWLQHVLGFGGTGIITLAVVVAGGGVASTAYAALYAIVAVDAFFVFSWRWAAVHLATVLIACPTAFALLPDVSVAQSVLLAGTFLVVAVVTAYLARAASAAEVDALTGLLNRRGFDRLLGEAMADAERASAPLMLALLDLDYFKSVNDTDGHAHGDHLLRSTAQAWRPMLRPGQVLARFGGDEFAILLPGCPPERAASVVEALREAVPAGRTCSAGLAEWEPGDSASMLINRADVALYAAKRSGRNRANQHEGEAGRGRELARAISSGELVVHFQPVVDLQAVGAVGMGRDAITAAEALVRWEHPTRGTVPPLQFILYAESRAIILDLGQHVLRAACAAAATWPVGPAGRRSVAVNVSARELCDRGYARRVAEALDEAGLPPTALVIEVTESSTETDDPQLTRSLHEVRELGAHVAVDDFGTGYSSLSRLASLPVDVLKIDRSFVQPLGSGPRSTTIVSAITGLGTALGLTVVAEGIETAAQADVLRGLGCARGQGYFFGRPVPADAFAASLHGPGAGPSRAALDALGAGGPLRLRG
ncbi:putative bifunctional diguanylate cyclase/phosphodiesterase [Motilibacter deserti]|uniref:EAL domain-containing protein n=1 Tax=Motilibacter deserti TaxID=2714956 RepID=A0ABX0GXK9_9ACTN|nr:EAL domain-containing protein [Motilibacter deserti]NHC14354.1 EAL domain-containing protein [Motilibacter deserti]